MRAIRHRLLHRLGGAEPATHHDALSLPTQFLLDAARTEPAWERADVAGESGEERQVVEEIPSGWGTGQFNALYYRPL